MVRQKSLQHIAFRASVKIFSDNAPYRCHHATALVIAPVNGGVARHNRGIAGIKIGGIGCRKHGYRQIMCFAVGKFHPEVAVAVVGECRTLRSVYAISVAAVSHNDTSVNRKVGCPTAEIEQQVKTVGFHPCERHSLRHSDIHAFITVGKLHTQPPVAPIISYRFRWTETPAFHRNPCVVLHFTAIAAPMVWMRHKNAAAVGFHHLRIAPQHTAVGVDKQVCPPIVGGYGFSLLAVGNIDATGLHNAALVAAMLVGLRLDQRRILRIAAAAHRHGLLRRYNSRNGDSSCQKQIISHSSVLKSSRRVTTRRESSILFAINELRYLTIFAVTTVPSALTALTT